MRRFVTYRPKIDFRKLNPNCLFWILLLTNSLWTFYSFPQSGNFTKNSKKEIILLTEGKVDSSSYDSRPLISPDGKQLYYGKRNYAKNAGGKRDFQDIWLADINTLGEFVNTHNLGNTINNFKPNGIYSISPDGNEIIVSNDYVNNRIAPIAKSSKVNGAWTKPTPIFIEDYYNKSPYVDFYLSYEHQVLFVAAERNNRKGDQDIFICFPDERGNWLKPISLGITLNSNSADFAPFLASNGKTLFFCSTRNGGFGGSDIYASTRLDDTWTKWSEPVNLGSTINTSGNEDYFSLPSSTDYIFVESISKETQERHMYTIALPKEIQYMGKDLLVSSK